MTSCIRVYCNSTQNLSKSLTPSIQDLFLYSAERARGDESHNVRLFLRVHTTAISPSRHPSDNYDCHEASEPQLMKSCRLVGQLCRGMTDTFVENLQSSTITPA